MNMNSAQPILLVTDLDNTLVGDDLATKRFNQYLDDHRQNYVVVYATGRSYDSAKQLMQERKLLEPNYWVTGVGTEIYSQNYLDLTWAIKLSTDWQRQAIADLIEVKFPELQLQINEEQNPWKLSFHLRNYDQSSAKLQTLGQANQEYDSEHPIPTQNHFSQACILRESDRFKNETINRLNIYLQQMYLSAQIVYSSSIDVDVLPINANKGNAVAYIQQKLGIPSYRTLVCGDSGNDISMFHQTTLGVIVNNAQPELIDWYHSHAESNHYLANKPYASGILEALQKFNLLVA